MKKTLITLALLVGWFMNLSAQTDSFIPKSLLVRIQLSIQNEINKDGGGFLFLRFKDANGIKDWNETIEIVNHLTDNPNYADTFVYKQYLDYYSSQDYYDDIDYTKGAFYRFLKNYFDLWPNEYETVVSSCRTIKEQKEAQAVWEKENRQLEMINNDEIFSRGEVGIGSNRDSNVILSESLYDLFDALPLPSHFYDTRFSPIFVLCKDHSIRLKSPSDTLSFSDREKEFWSVLQSDNQKHPENYVPGEVLNRPVNSYYGLEIKEEFEPLRPIVVHLNKKKGEWIFEGYEYPLWSSTSESLMTKFPQGDEPLILETIIKNITESSLLEKKRGSQGITVAIYRRKITIGKYYSVLSKYCYSISSPKHLVFQ